MENGWTVLGVVIDLIVAGIAGFALTFAGRMVFNLTSNDDAGEHDHVFRDIHGCRVRGGQLLAVSFGEAFGFLFMSKLGFLISMGLTALVCLIFAGSSTLNAGDMFHDLGGGNQSDYANWAQVEWFVAFLASAAIIAIFVAATRPRQAAASSDHH